VVGTFDSQLGWDIFPRALERVLYGIFFSSLALAAVGIALSFVLGIHELTTLLRASLAGADPPAQRPMRHYLRLAGAGVTILVVAIAVLDFVDRRVQVHRRGEFKRLAREQMDRFVPKLAPELPADAGAPAVSAKLALLVDTIDNLDFIANATLYVADGDPEVLWRYTPRGSYTDAKPAFQRIFVTRSVERAVRDALDGDARGLAKENERQTFAWLAPVGDAAQPKAVLSVTADETENFRAFSGSR
jgi:PAS domain-containing protein